MTNYSFWNNKGGTGKTTLAFQVICDFAQNSNDEILVVDVCPQANLSELLLGGLEGSGSNNLLIRQGTSVRATLGGYFQSRLPTPYGVGNIDINSYLTKPNEFNPSIPDNITLLCGDPILELQSNAISTLANNQIPGTDTWLSIVDWINDFITQSDNRFKNIFFDLNPSFSIYTQIALAATDSIILPVMADDSSRRALQNAFSLIHGLRLPSPIYAQHAFANRLKTVKRSLPRVHTIAKNRLTQYMGPASAYATVLQTIDNDIEELLTSNPNIFDFESVDDAFVDIRDFQTTGVVAHARGTPFYKLRSGNLLVGGRRVQVNDEQRMLAVQAINNISRRL